MSDLFFFKDDELIHRAKQKPWQATKAPKFQDHFELAYSNAEPEELRDDELPGIVGSVMFYDVECFRNYFLVAFRSLATGKVISLEQDETSSLHTGKLDWLLNNFCIIGYNSINYDILLLELALTGASCETLFQASCDIILHDIRPHDFERKYKVKRRKYNHVDLIEVAPLQGSLKLYAGRLHTKRMQDLPVVPLEPLSPQEKIDVRIYCHNDTANTELLFQELEQPLVLRSEMSVQYGVDLRSKSDAQIAETVISSELKKLNGFKVDRPQVDPHRSYQYRVPPYISYRTPVLQQMLEIVRNASFAIDGLGYIIMPPEIANLLLPVGQCIYKMGVGGLHSTEKTIAHVADDDTLLIDRDVASYYPSIVLNQKLMPKHLGASFLTVYLTLVQRRLDAKKTVKRCKDDIDALRKNPEGLNNDEIKKRYKALVEEKETAETEADSLKITINGLFGKLGSKWSIVYAPDLMIQVTLTGQLCLLLLIEMIEDLGIPVVSANTDGVVIKCPKAAVSALQERIAWWEQLTGFQTEETRYKAIYSRDVNNYIAIKEKTGDEKAPFLDERLGVKVKGCYGERGSAGNSVLSKNPENLICNDAVMELLRNGTPVEETIRACRDIRRFVTIRNVTGGARKSNVYLGKVIRWYYSTEMKGEINRATKGDKIPNSDRARPLMEMPADFPSDIDYDRYIEIAKAMLHQIGYLTGTYKASTGELGPLFDVA